MPAYCLFDNLKIDDYAKLEQYKIGVAPIVAMYDGRYVVVGGKVDLMEGQWKPTFPVMIEFPSLERAKQWYNSAEYKPFKELRKSAGTYNAVFFEELSSATPAA